MASSSTVAGPRSVQDWTSLLLLPNLLSLDAPLIALVWQHAVAKSFAVTLTAPMRITLFAAVWAVYLFDRILDARRLPVKGWQAPRRTFSRRRGTQLVFLCAASVCAGAVLSLQLPVSLICAGCGVGAAVICYLAAAHLGPAQRCWPRECMVALVFALGCSATVWSRPGALPALVPTFVLFALLCVLDCSLLECWEWERNSLLSQPSYFAAFLADRLRPLVAAIFLAAPVLALAHAISSQIAAAACTSSAFWLVASANRHRIPPQFITLTVDVALLSPLFFLH